MNIIGYTYLADIFCPACIVPAMTVRPRFDGWNLAPGIMMTTEENLDEIAAHYQIDRESEWTFESDDFPKVILDHQVDQTIYCTTCQEDLS